MVHTLATDIVFNVGMVWPTFTVQVNIWLVAAGLVALLLWRIAHAKWVHRGSYRGDK